MPSNQKQRKRNVNQAIFVALAFVVAAIGVYQFRAWSLNKDKVVASFVSAGSESDTVLLEVAQTPGQRNKGLMFRKEMPRGEGMLFVFPEEGKQSFWMKNTYISLDMIFLNSAKKVVGILERVPVLNEKPRTVDEKAMYVVELNAGSASELGVKVGSEMKFKTSPEFEAS